jgi:hypothetical protein
MAGLELTLEDFSMDGWIYTTRLERRLRKLQGEGQYKQYLNTLKEFNREAYKNLGKLVRGALWKTRKAKFKRYYHNILDKVKSY